jgi:hypothetical protein
MSIETIRRLERRIARLEGMNRTASLSVEHIVHDDKTDKVTTKKLNLSVSALKTKLDSLVDHQEMMFETEGNKHYVEFSAFDAKTGNNHQLIVPITEETLVLFFKGLRFPITN